MAWIKGIVMENRHGQAVILSPDGEYIRVRTREPLEVGELYEGSAAGSWRYALIVVLMLVLSLGTIDFFSVKAYAQMSDSVELGVNRWGLVVSTRALDDEGAQILQNFNLKGKKVGTAAEEIASQIKVEENMGQDHTVKVFPTQAAVKENKDPDFGGNKDEDFIKRVTDNMNQGLTRAQEKSNNQANIEKANNNENSNSQSNSNVPGNDTKSKP